MKHSYMSKSYNEHFFGIFFVIIHTKMIINIGKGSKESPKHNAPSIKEETIQFSSLMIIGHVSIQLGKQLMTFYCQYSITSFILISTKASNRVETQ